MVGIIALKEYVNLRDQGLPFNLWIEKDSPFYWNLGWHEFAELVYIIEGGIVQTVNKTTRRLSKGDLVFINGMDIHSIYTEPGTDTQLLLIQLPPSFISLFYRETGQVRMACNFYTNDLKKPYNDSLQSCMCDILFEMAEKKDGYRYLLTSHVYRLLGILLRNSPSINSSDKEYLEQKYLMDRISPALDYINCYYKTDISLKKAASEAGMCSQYFCKCFKKATTYTFTQYINELRVMSAQDLLLTSDMNITEIAYDVGFSSINYFNRIFKKITGTTPLNFRRK